MHFTQPAPPNTCRRSPRAIDNLSSVQYTQPAMAAQQQALAFKRSRGLPVLGTLFFALLIRSTSSLPLAGTNPRISRLEENVQAAAGSGNISADDNGEHTPVCYTDKILACKFSFNAFSLSVPSPLNPNLASCKLHVRIPSWIPAKALRTERRRAPEWCVKSR
ncbi:hypothetical protein FGB62_102g023 [Gracilaria domingensis]|nr:hypothetical protein FGB62_102g023 [Gracilaria domingensis]